MFLLQQTSNRLGSKGLPDSCKRLSRRRACSSFPCGKSKSRQVAFMPLCWLDRKGFLAGPNNLNTEVMISREAYHP